MKNLPFHVQFLFFRGVYFLEKSFFISPLLHPCFNPLISKNYFPHGGRGEILINIHTSCIFLSQNNNIRNPSVACIRFCLSKTIIRKLLFPTFLFVQERQYQENYYFPFFFLSKKDDIQKTINSLISFVKGRQ